MEQPIIKVGIVDNREIIVISLTGKFLLNDSLELKDEKFSVVIKDNSMIMFRNSDEPKKFDELFFKAINPDKSRFSVEDVTVGIAFHWEKAENETFEGDFRIINENGRLTLINEILIEKYLESVISSEMNAESPFEYLKAHSIISRSWLLAQLELSKKKKNTPATGMINNSEEIIKWYDKEDHKNYDVCNDDHCQRYHGVTYITDNKSVKAVRETAGMVLKYEDEICDTRYYKCCGGITEEFQNVWQDTYMPYLPAVYDSKTPLDYYPDDEEKARKFIESSYDAYCNTKDSEFLRTILVNFDQATKDFFRWEIQIKQLALSTLLKLKLNIDFGEIIDLVPIQRGKSGRLIKLKIIGTKNSITIGKELEIRRALSEKHLYSSAFIVEKQYNENSHIPAVFILKGAGWGHGVGFCQIGGAVMAKEGFKFDEILFHYFKNSRLEKIY